MIQAMSESSASCKRTMSHATTRVSSDIDVKRPVNHQGIVSTRFNFNIPQEWPVQLSLQSKRRCTPQSERKPLPLPSAAYAMTQFAEESDCRFLTWLYGAKIPCTIQKIYKSTRKQYLNHSYSCYEKVKNEKDLQTFFFSIFFLPFQYFSCYSVSRYFVTCFPCVVTPCFDQQSSLAMRFKTNHSSGNEFFCSSVRFA